MNNFNPNDYTLTELENMYDPYYMYSDDYSVFSKHSAISQAIRARKEAAQKENKEQSNV